MTFITGMGSNRLRPAVLISLLGSVILLGSPARGADGGVRTFKEAFQPLQRPARDTASAQVTPNLWGLDVLVSSDGFGLGTFFRREVSPDISWFLSFSVSESKDSREVERFDPYTGMSYVPGKLNRFMVLPLMVGIQYRIFREDIVDTFRPYLNVGAGPTMIYAMPFAKLHPTGYGYIDVEQVEFFKSIGMGRAHYTAGAYIGIGANFGNEKVNVFGVNFRYYFTYLFGGGLPSLYNSTTGDVSSNKTDFGGFFITLNIGMPY